LSKSASVLAFLAAFIAIMDVPQARAATPPDGWRIRLDARIGGLTDKGGLTLGASSAASDGLDAFDDPHPPALPSRFLDLYTQHNQGDPGWQG